MPKNTKGGKGFKKGKKGGIPMSKQLILKEEGTQYATLNKNLGNNRFTCDCHDGRERLGHICGRMQKRVWLKIGDLVLVSTRDYQDEKCDIIHKYSEDNKNTLLKQGQIKKEKLMLAESGDKQDINKGLQNIGIEFSDGANLNGGEEEGDEDGGEGEGEGEVDINVI